MDFQTRIVKLVVSPLQLVPGNVWGASGGGTGRSRGCHVRSRGGSCQRLMTKGSVEGRALLRFRRSVIPRNSQWPSPIDARIIGRRSKSRMMQFGFAWSPGIASSLVVRSRHAEARLRWSSSALSASVR